MTTCEPPKRHLPRIRSMTCARAGTSCLTLGGATQMNIVSLFRYSRVDTSSESPASPSFLPTTDALGMRWHLVRNLPNLSRNGHMSIGFSGGVRGLRMMYWEPWSARKSQYSLSLSCDVYGWIVRGLQQSERYVWTAILPTRLDLYSFEHSLKFGP